MRTSPTIAPSQHPIDRSELFSRRARRQLERALEDLHRALRGRDTEQLRVATALTNSALRKLDEHHR